MRMWMVEPKIMCRKHLLGEHVELHMLVGSINKNKKLNGFIDNGLVEIVSITERHNELVEEMNNRGYNHNSSLPEFDLKPEYKECFVNREESLNELISRCNECNKLYKVMG